MPGNMNKLIGATSVSGNLAGLCNNAPQSGDPVWTRIWNEASGMARTEPILAGYLNDMVLRHNSLDAAIADLLSGKLASSYLSVEVLRDVIKEALYMSAKIRLAVRRDLDAFVDRDPAARGLAQPFLNYKGFHALQSYRVANWLWSEEREPLALHLQNRVSEVFDVDIHPAAVIGKGILIDHGAGVVIGETAVVGDDVSLLHEVTLGGSGKVSGDRHPKVGSGVLIGAGSKILGNVRIGTGSKVMAGSVVLGDVPPHCTVAGIPATVVGKPNSAKPALQMEHWLEPDFCI